MSRLRLVAGLATVAMLVPLADAQAVPSFTRATGLTCNQCHTNWAPFPDFTFTGKKFRLNGYRAPWVADRLEAGEEGALNGRRLALGLQNAFSLRFRSDLFNQSKSPSNPNVAAPEPNPIRNDPGRTISWFYVGPLAENFGLWNEFYLAEGGQARGHRFRVTTFDEYDIKFVLTPNDEHIVGLAYTTQNLSCLAGLCPYSPGIFANFGIMQRGGFNTAGTSYANVAIYGLFSDRVNAVFGVQPGEDNLDYSRMNFMGILTYYIQNTDYNQFLVDFQIKAGNDAIPIVTRNYIGPDSRQWLYRDAVRGISDTRGAGAGPYLAFNTGDFVRTLSEIQYGFVDRGPHSLQTGIGVGLHSETYDDGAETKQSNVGGVVRYEYDRTWGLETYVWKVTNFEFTDVAGVVHDIPQDVGVRAYLKYRPAMNVALFFSGGNSQASVLDENWRNGWSWNLQLDFMF